MTSTSSQPEAARRPTAIRFWLLTAALLLVQIAWLGFLLLSIAGVQFRDGVGQPLSFWLLWEMASIGVTVAVTIVFWISCFMREDDHSIFEGSSVRYGASGALLLLLFGIGFLVAGWCAWEKKSLTLQVCMLALGVLGTIGLELLAMASTFDALKKRASSWTETKEAARKGAAWQVRTILGNRDNVAKFLCFSDVPIAFAILSLAAMVAIHDSLGVPFDETAMRSFVAGTVAIQLLYSNFVFWLEALADYPKGHSLLGSLPNWLRSIRHMLHPAGHLPSDATPKWANEVLKQFFPELFASGQQTTSTSRVEASKEK